MTSRSFYNLCFYFYWLVLHVNTHKIISDLKELNYPTEGKVTVQAAHTASKVHTYKYTFQKTTELVKIKNNKKKTFYSNNFF